MTKAIEILFRHRLRLLLLLMLPTLLGLAISWKLPRQYQASAGLWALHRYEILGATGPESDLTSTPAETQATTLTELLASRSFALTVAYATDLPQTIGVAGSDTVTLQDALYTEISTHVQVSPVGYNLFEITYSNTNPVVAMQVVKSVVFHYGTQSTSQSTAEGEQLLISYQSQLLTAQQAANSATKTASQYLQLHQLTPAEAQVDPQYQLLNANANQALAALSNIQNNITTINQQLATLSAGSAGLYNVMDPPIVPSRPESRTKTLLFGAGGGLAAGLLAAVLYFLILSRLDQSVYTLVDVPEVTSYPVLVQVPWLPLSLVALTSLLGE
jgi:capsular polysaccharide biosynthesis protein